ncbi:MAG: xanthine dehydrogenase family protein molybdopterin-binding subunit [Chloroflexi bacterium]|nr:xanthine dehydrogenase family protein molybdopterin-binding subunit [Chloroflexota bacterium]
MSELAVVGKPVPRIDAKAKAMGRLEYVSDTTLPKMLHAKILRSPHPHARIVHIDTRKASALPGVKAVVTADDFPPVRCGNMLKDRTVLARGKVRYVGEKVAAVAAVDEETARKALDLIEVEYEPLPAVFDATEAMQPGAPVLHEDLESYGSPGEMIRYGNVCSVTRIKRGDVEQGFKEADHIFEDTYTTQMAHQGYAEPHVAVNWMEASGRLVMQTTNTNVFRVRDDTCQVLGLAPERVRLLGGPIGGSFGGKNEAPLDPICARLTQKTGRPVRLAMDRMEEFCDATPRHSCVIHLKTGVKRDGRIIARQARMIFDTGAYADFGPAVASEAAKQISGPYRIPHLKIESFCVYTNKISCGCCRSHGTPQPTFAFESQMDAIAAELGMDPIELRLKNAVEDGDVFATGEPVHNATLKHVLEEVARQALPLDRTAEGSKRRGRGVACGQWHSGGRPSGVLLRMNENGSVVVIPGVVDMTGGHTSVVQMVAEELGIPVADIQVAPMDTDIAPFDSGASGTRVTYNLGLAARMAAGEIRDQLIKMAAEMLEASSEDLELRDGHVFVKGSPEKRLPLAWVAQHLYRAQAGLVLGKGWTLGEFLPIDPTVWEGLCFSGGVEHVFGAQVADVEVDTETGQVRVLQVTAAHDTGRVINPPALTGQIEGGVAQGVGYALCEEVVCQEGRVLHPYGVPYAQITADMVPVVDAIAVEDKPGEGPYGAKGIAETAIIPTAPAIANAVYDAVGVRITSLPITPEKVLAALSRLPGG